MNAPMNNASYKLVRIDEPSIDCSRVKPEFQPREIVVPFNRVGGSPIVIGRHNVRKCPDFCIESGLNARMISRRHATLSYNSKGQLVITDHSLNGTYVNYVRVKENVVLNDGNVVTFGHMNGANIKMGESVPQYPTDMKYRVEIILKSEENISPVPPTVTTPQIPQPSNNISTLNVSQTSSIKPKRQNSSIPQQKSSTTVNSKGRKSSSNNSVSKPLNNLKRKNGSTSGSRSSQVNKRSHQSGGIDHDDDDDERRGMAEDDEEDDDEDEDENDQCKAKPCRKPSGGNIDWIQCDDCEHWYHQICVGIKSSREVEDSETYTCPYCKKASHK